MAPAYAWNKDLIRMKYQRSCCCSKDKMQFRTAFSMTKRSAHTHTHAYKKCLLEQSIPCTVLCNPWETMLDKMSCGGSPPFNTCSEALVMWQWPKNMDLDLWMDLLNGFVECQRVCTSKSLTPFLFFFFFCKRNMDFCNLFSSPIYELFCSR